MHVADMVGDVPDGDDSSQHREKTRQLILQEGIFRSKLVVRVHNILLIVEGGERLVGVVEIVVVVVVVQVVSRGRSRSSRKRAAGPSIRTFA